MLRQLRRRGHAAIFDLVSRPGAHYVAWRLPGDVGALPVMAGAELGTIEEVLSAYERSLGEASIYAPPDALAQVYALEFAALPTAALPPGQATPVSGSGDQETSLGNPGCGCVDGRSSVVAGGRFGTFRNFLVVVQSGSAGAK